MRNIVKKQQEEAEKDRAARADRKDDGRAQQNASRS